jgi:hypothetical protein
MTHDRVKAAISLPSITGLRRFRIAPSIAALSIVIPAVAQETPAAVQWRVEDGGNGHWYAFRLEPMSASMNCWSSAVEHARAQGGDLLALSSLDEEAFVVAALCDDAPLSSIDGQHYYGWIGFTGTGHWSNGEPETYIHWGNSGPSGDGPHVRMRGLDCQVYGWNDIGGSDGCHPTGADALYYTMEWEADCNGDGIVDYGQILDGTFDDVDDNGVPDCCDAGVSCDTPCPADLSEDGVVNPIDLGLLLTFWGTDGQNNPQADIDGDGYVGPTDLGLLLGAWGACPER